MQLTLSRFFLAARGVQLDNGVNPRELDTYLKVGWIGICTELV